MRQELSRSRRFLVAAIALLSSSLLFRAQIANALVIRGDDYMYRGDRVQALERYRRALTIAPALEVAADRYIVLSLQRQTPESIARALVVANTYLRGRPGDAVVLADRALCFLHTHRYADAERDFERAAYATHSVTDFVFAGWAARHAGSVRRAAALWRQALRLKPDFRPAVVALSELH